MITVDAALEPLWAVAAQQPYRLTYTHTITEYHSDPLLQQPRTEFKIDPILHCSKTGQGPAACN